MGRFTTGFAMFMLSQADSSAQYYPPAPSQAAAAGMQRGADRHSAIITQRQEQSTSLRTCGYENGNPTLARSAELGYDCRTDTLLGIWGFCAASISAASECGMAGACVDQANCSNGCGLLGYPTLVNTYTCNESGPNSLCSTALMIPNRDQTYQYIVCGPRAETITYFEEPTATLADSSATSEAGEESTRNPGGSTGEESVSTTSQNPTSGAPVSTSNALPEAGTGDDGGSSTNVGAIVGGVLGGVAILCLTVVAIVWIRRRRSKMDAPPMMHSPSIARKEYRYEPAPSAGVIHELPGQQLDNSRGSIPSWRQSRSELSASRS